MRKIFIAATLLTMSALLQSQTNPCLGEWMTVDDKTGDSYSVVTIYQESNGLFYGKITQMLYPGTENLRCEKCVDEDHNQPILGLVIIRDMLFKDGVLQAGKVLDPNNGKFYYGKISVENGILCLRGSLDKKGWFGRNQYWKRKTDE